jgi:hypothetical protein
MGPFKAIAAFIRIMGQFKGIDTINQTHKWAHPRPLAASTRDIMGPFKLIGSTCPDNDGPIQGHWQHLLAEDNGPI